MSSANERFDVILDLDGPLLDGRYRHYACYSRILKAHGRSPVAIEHYWEMKREGVNRRVQLASASAEDLYDVFLEEWLKLIESEEMLALDRLQDGAFDSLTRLSSRGHAIVLATARRNQVLLREQLHRLGILEAFSGIAIVSPEGEVGRSKAQALAHLLPLKTGSVFVGDTEADILAGRELGCETIALSCGLRNASFLARHNPDRLFPVLGDWVASVDVNPSGRD